MARSLTESAWLQQQAFEASTSNSERRERGHFGTPPAIASFMAQMAPTDHSAHGLRLLDPGAGVGMLTAAVCDLLKNQRTTTNVFAELWEVNPALQPFLAATMESCRKALGESGIELTYQIRMEDFILDHSRSDLFSNGPSRSFDLAILNPPYYKLRKDSLQARNMSHLVHGQPNIYSLFMGVAADLLVDGGQFVAITPRSYFNGPYFKRFRKWFFDRMAVRQIHSFESREEAFRDDEVLQENVIISAEKRRERGEVLVTSSEGRMLSDIARCVVPYHRVVADSAGDHVVRLTTNVLDRDLMEALDRLKHRLHAFDIEISTGPVVTFRATEFLRDCRTDNTAPLLWMHNVRPFRVQSVDKAGKPAHIAVQAVAKKLLVPAKRYVLLKRFTSKEENRRLVAGIFQPEDSYCEWLGLENHLNYVYRRRSELTQNEAWGLAAYFNSSFVDRYFRAVSGNTQVNAAEIRSLPIPDLRTMSLIGLSVAESPDPNSETVDAIVGQALGLKGRQISGLQECVQ